VLFPTHPTVLNPIHPTVLYPTHFTVLFYTSHSLNRTYPTHGAVSTHPTVLNPIHPTVLYPTHATSLYPTHPTVLNPIHPTELFYTSHGAESYKPIHPTVLYPTHSSQRAIVTCKAGSAACVRLAQCMFLEIETMPTLLLCDRLSRPPQPPPPNVYPSLCECGHRTVLWPHPQHPSKQEALHARVNFHERPS